MPGILALSDLAWGAKEKNASGTGRVDGDSFLSLADEIDPDVVVFAGDSVYDRCSRSAPNETDLFVALLDRLAAAGRHCIVVEGDNDNSHGTYGRVRDASAYLHEISSKAETVRGIRFLGVPTGTERRMAEATREAVDIVVAHAPTANRTWLFDLPASCIVTGHYGMLVDEIAGKAYVALDCSPSSYAEVDWEQGWRRIEYAAGSCRIEMNREEGGSRASGTGCDIADFRRLRRGEDSLSYREEIEALRRAKREAAIFGRREVFERLLAMGIAKTHIERYLGRRPAR